MICCSFGLAYHGLKNPAVPIQLKKLQVKERRNERKALVNLKEPEGHLSARVSAGASAPAVPVRRTFTEGVFFLWRTLSSTPLVPSQLEVSSSLPLTE